MDSPEAPAGSIPAADPPPRDDAPNAAPAPLPPGTDAGATASDPASAPHGAARGRVGASPRELLVGALAGGAAAYLSARVVGFSPPETAALLEAGRVGAALLGALDAARLGGAAALALAAAAAVCCGAAGVSGAGFRAAVAGGLALAGQASMQAAAGDVRAAPYLLGMAALFVAGPRLVPVAFARRAALAGAFVLLGVGLATVLSAANLAAIAQEARRLLGRDASAALSLQVASAAGLAAPVYFALRGRAARDVASILVGALGLFLFAAGRGGDGDPSPFATPTAGATALALLVAAAFARAASAIRGTADGLVLLAAFALFLSGHAESAARERFDQDATRLAAARIVAQADRTLPAREQPGDVVLGVPERGDLRLRSVLRAAGRTDLAFDLAEYAARPPKRLRAARYGAPMAGGFGAALAPELQLAFDALVDPAVALERPVPNAALPSLRPEDEPEFVFSLPVGTDPGPDAHLFTAVLFVHEDDGRVRARGVPLDASLVERVEADGRATYTWRPSWRSGSHADTELRIERGDLGAPGTRTWWTILVGAPHSGLCAAARPPVEPKNPRFAARLKRPTTCAVPAAFDLPAAATP